MVPQGVMSQPPQAALGISHSQGIRKLLSSQQKETAVVWKVGSLLVQSFPGIFPSENLPENTQGKTFSIILHRSD